MHGLGAGMPSYNNGSYERWRRTNIDFNEIHLLDHSLAAVWIWLDHGIKRVVTPSLRRVYAVVYAMFWREILKASL